MNVCPTGRTVGRSSGVTFVSSIATSQSFSWLPNGLRFPRGPALPAMIVYGTSGGWKPGEELWTREQLPAVAAQQSVGPEPVETTCQTRRLVRRGEHDEVSWAPA